jgi:hypothetical protein
MDEARPLFRARKRLFVAMSLGPLAVMLGTLVVGSAPWCPRWLIYAVAPAFFASQIGFQIWFRRWPCPFCGRAFSPWLGRRHWPRELDTCVHCLLSDPDA